MGRHYPNIASNPRRSAAHGLPVRPRDFRLIIIRTGHEVIAGAGDEYRLDGMSRFGSRNIAVIPREAVLREGFNGFTERRDAGGVAGIMEKAPHDAFILMLIGSDAGGDHPLFGYDPKIECVTGLRRQFAHEMSLGTAIAFAERMHSIEIGHIEIGHDIGGLIGKFGSR